jgi:hypothetical protein
LTLIEAVIYVCLKSMHTRNEFGHSKRYRKFDASQR